MGSKKIDLVPAGGAVAYDAKTGEILWAHERVVEVEERDEYGDSDEFDVAECEAIREQAARVFRNREVRVLALPAGTTLEGDRERSVDVASGKLVERERRTPSLAERFAAAD